jgi:hypothetical protein
MDLGNVVKTINTIKELMVEMEKPECDEWKFEELKAILEAIGKDSELYSKYEEIYIVAADSLMFAGVSLAKYKCDPIRKHVPVYKVEE